MIDFIRFGYLQTQCRRRRVSHNSETTRRNSDTDSTNSMTVNNCSLSEFTEIMSSCEDEIKLRQPKRTKQEFDRHQLLRLSFLYSENNFFYVFIIQDQIRCIKSFASVSRNETRRWMFNGKKCIKKLCTHIISKFKVRSEFSDIFSIHQKYCFQVSFFKKTRVYAISIKFLILSKNYHYLVDGNTLPLWEP